MKRNEIDVKYKWKLEDIYANDSLWEQDVAKVKELAAGFVQFEGKLSENSGMLLECLKFNDMLSMTVEKVFVYARMRRDEDNAVSQYQGYVNIATGVYSQALTAT